MNILSRSTAALLALALPAAAAPAATQPCFTPEEAQNLITVMLPDAIGLIAEKCRPALPADSFLSRDSAGLIARYEPVAETAIRTLRPTMSKFIPGRDVLDKLDDDTLRKMLAAGVSTQLARDLKPERCADVERVVVALAPLPPENMAMLFGALFRFLSRVPKSGGKSSGPFQICPAVGAAK